MRTFALAAGCLACASALLAPRPPESSGGRLYSQQQPQQITDVFVGNMKYGTSPDDLRDLATELVPGSDILKVTIPKDAETGFERGFGFIKVSSAADAKMLVAELNNLEVEGRVLNARISESKDRPPKKRELTVMKDAYAEIFDLQAEGVEAMKAACRKAGVKVGGDDDQIARRLWSMRGLTDTEIKVYRGD